MSTVLDEQLSPSSSDQEDRIYRIKKSFLWADITLIVVVILASFFLFKSQSVWIFFKNNLTTYMVLGGGFAYYLLRTIMLSVGLPSFARTFCLILHAGHWLLFPVGLHFSMQSYPYGNELLFSSMVVSLLQVHLQVWLLPENKTLRFPLIWAAVAMSLMAVAVWIFFTQGYDFLVAEFLSNRRVPSLVELPGFWLMLTAAVACVIAFFVLVQFWSTDKQKGRFLLFYLAPLGMLIGIGVLYFLQRL